MIEIDQKTLNCAGCTACCKGDTIILRPEEGDDPSKYQTVEVVDIRTGEPRLMLDHKKNGDCIYLDDHRGCTIHEHRPVVCRTFDCRVYAACLPVMKREEMIRNGAVSRRVVNAGMRRIDTLTPAERTACLARRSELINGGS